MQHKYPGKSHKEICFFAGEKQEKAADKMTELDALRAKRAAEEAEREARIKEKNDSNNKTGKFQR